MISDLVKPDQELGAAQEQGPANEMGLPGQKLQGFGTSGWVLCHLTLAVKFVACIEKLLVISIADQLIKFAFGEALFVEITRSEIESKFVQETSCLATGGSRGLLIECNFTGSHFSS